MLAIFSDVTVIIWYSDYSYTLTLKTKQSLLKISVYFLSYFVTSVNVVGVSEAAILGQSILLFIPKFSWNKVPGEDDEKLLESLKKIGALRHEPEIQIQKSSDNNTISLVTPHNIVTVKLDTTAHKAFVWDRKFCDIRI